MNDFARVKAAVDIAEVIGRHVALKKSGSRLVGLCPFHAEKTPSFGVIEEGQYFKCFGCGKGGDVFVFLQELLRLEPSEALRQLADEAGVPLSEKPGTAPRSKQSRVLEASEAAWKHFRKCLASEEGARARQVWKDRGLHDETVKTFGLGYAPPARGFLGAMLQRQGFRSELLQDAGLMRRREGRVYDVFRDRLVIPIRDARGRPVAFGGRRLEDGPEAREPKYLNSPETAIFHKSRTLFGLDLARPAILEEDRAVLVEGYLDVILAHQAGVRCAVAALGTAVTEDHGKILSRIAPRVIVFLDGDNAGRAAAVKSVPILMGAGLRVQVLVPPDGQDPGDYFADGRTATDFDAFLGAAGQSGLDFLLSEMGGRSANSFEDRADAARRVAEALGSIQDGVVRTTALQHVASELDLPAEVLVNSRGFRQRAQKKPSLEVMDEASHGTAQSATPRRSETDRISTANAVAEEELLLALLHRQELRELAAELVEPGTFQHPLRERLFNELVAHPTADVRELLDLHAGQAESQAVLLDLTERPILADPGKLFDGALQFFERIRQEQQGREIKKRYQEGARTGDTQLALRFLSEYQHWRKGEDPTQESSL